MLENASLDIRAWNASLQGQPAGRVRTVTDSAGVTLGFVRQAASRWPRWLSWLSRPPLEVCEIPDGSLIFGLRHNWTRPGSWEIIDADERVVGTVRGRALLDGFGHLLATVEAGELQGHGRIMAVQGRELATFAISPDGSVLKFATETAGNPFARMMLLAAVLLRSVQNQL